MKLFLAFATLLLAQAIFAQGQIRNLTPRADSPTAMRRCGADLETVKTQRGLSVRYVFTGEEVLHKMQYCVTEAGNEIHIAQSDYHVPPGTIGWTNKSASEVVLEECVNGAECEGCKPETPVPAPAPAISELTPRPPVAELPPPPQDVPVNPLPPEMAVLQQPEIDIFLTKQKHKFPIPCIPREKNFFGIFVPIVECGALAFGAYEAFEAVQGGIALAKIVVPIVSPTF